MNEVEKKQHVTRILVPREFWPCLYEICTLYCISNHIDMEFIDTANSVLIRDT